ncbi:bromo-adjacent-likey (BAH) domain-containing protein [Quillaja saponaria]|uniref:Bromo-adjacent-likey (BAH) domain-containing protein n=1 Tax=Quillaja saponaria TaxID=32244 RepID=A0AAD7PLH5_QUISA|nr:bromo-adjacent-likey (BAH) domain-containing protein [Quillaja saponaria]
MKRKETEREKEFGCLCKVEEEEEIVYMGTHQSFADQDFHEEDEELSFQNGQQPQSCVSEESVSKMNVKEEVEEEQSEGEESQKYGGEEEEPPLVNANAIGGPLRVSGEGRKKKYHYKAFEFDGNQYELEDFVLVAPDKIDDKPHVAVIKDITQGKNGCVMVTTQWFYRPKEVEREGNGRWNACDARALFYSFHVDEISAESVMHKCVVHFVPMHKKIPKRTEHPGFIVQRVYDHREERLYKLTDGDYKGNKQNEIDLLLHKTWSLLGDLPDIVTEEAPLNQEHGCDISREERKQASLINI